MKRWGRRTGSSWWGGTNGRLITERHTRETKKTTNAAAVHGSPPCHPNTSTAAAPSAKSVNQNARNRPSAIRNPQSASSLPRCRPHGNTFEETSQEFLHTVGRIQIPL